jgi:hypothetical protein
MSDKTKTTEKKGGEQLDWNPYTYALYPTLCGVSFFLAVFGFVEMVPTYDIMWKISLVYFVIDLVVQLMAMDFTYIVHHTIVLIFLLMRSKWPSDELYLGEWFEFGMIMEMSNVFFNIRPMFTKGSMGAQLNDITFVVVWFVTRIFYAIPTAWKNVLGGSDGGFPNAMLALLVTLTVMHAYWGYLMIKKIWRMLNPKPKKAD